MSDLPEFLDIVMDIFPEYNKVGYSVRGQGKDYTELYTWLRTTSYCCVEQDFPWDYFVFGNSEDDEIIMKKFGKFIRTVKETQN